MPSKPDAQNFTIDELDDVLTLLNVEYIAQFSDYKIRIQNPPKIVKVLGAEGAIPTKTCSVVYGYLSHNGFFGSKTVYSEDTPEGTKRQSVTNLFDPSGKLVAVYESSNLTVLRCGLMAVYTAEKMAPLEPKNVVGLIGLGKINLGILNLLYRMRGVRNFVVRPSRFAKSPGEINPRINIFVDDSNKEFSNAMRYTTFVSSATTNSEKTRLLSAGEVRGPGLLIAWDTGYMFGPSVRTERTHYSDYPEQLKLVKDIEFPWDFSFDPEPLINFNRNETPAIVSLYGIGMLDVLVAYAAFRKGVQ
jgi:hypothetical protein